MEDSMRSAADDSIIDILRDEGFRDKLKQGEKELKKFGGQQIVEAAITKLPKLYRAAMEGDWEVAGHQFRHNQDAKTAKISNLGMTALHVAASCGQSEFVQKLVEELAEEQLAKLQLEARDQLGRTVLHHVALAADVDAAKAMVTKNPILPYLGDVNRLTPLFYAAKWRHPSESKKMVEYLYGVSLEEDLPRDHVGRDVCNAFTDDSAPDLIVAITASGSYDTALRILKRYPELALKKNPEGTSILHVLSMKPKVFRSGNELSPLRSWIYDLVPVDDEETQHEDSTSDGANSKNRCSAASFFKYLGKFIKGIREMSEMKQSHGRAVRLVEFVCDELQKKEKEEEEEKEKEKAKEPEKEREKEEPEKGKAWEKEEEEKGKEREKEREKEKKQNEKEENEPKKEKEQSHGVWI
nr:pre-mRNA-splicing factor CWC22 homolog [Coffea arabica]